MKNPLEITFFRLNFCKNSPIKKTLVWSIELLAVAAVPAKQKCWNFSSRLCR
jgi:hypothetical protein